MSSQSFTATQREAIWLAYDRKCAYTRQLLDISNFHIDHILPESLKDDPLALFKTLSSLGLPAEFDLFADDGHPEDDGDEGQCWSVFYTLEQCCEAGERIVLTDADGEDILIRPGNLSLLSVPLWVVDPNELSGEFVGREPEPEPQSAWFTTQAVTTDLRVVGIRSKHNDRRRYITFDRLGKIVMSFDIGAGTAYQLHISPKSRINQKLLTKEHEVYLAHHRESVFRGG